MSYDGNESRDIKQGPLAPKSDNSWIETLPEYQHPQFQPAEPQPANQRAARHPFKPHFLTAGTDIETPVCFDCGEHRQAEIHLSDDIVNDQRVPFEQFAAGPIDHTTAINEARRAAFDECIAIAQRHWDTYHDKRPECVLHVIDDLRAARDGEGEQK